MQATDARLLRGAAVPTVAAGVVAVVVCSIVVGSKGLIGAVLGTALVIAFFSVSIIVVGRTARRQPEILMGVALLTYVVKLLFLAVLLIAFKHTTAFHAKAFAWTIVGCTVVWIAAELITFSKMKLLYVDPAGPASER